MAAGCVCDRGLKSLILRVRTSFPFVPMPAAVKKPILFIPSDIMGRGSQQLRYKKRTSPKRVAVEESVYLKNKWSMWFENYETEDRTKIGAFATVQNFWRYYNQLVEPSKFPERSNLSIYKGNSSATSTDIPKACKWIIPCTKGDTGKVWMKTVVAVLSEQFSRSSHIYGVSLSVFPLVDNVIVWGNEKATPRSIARILHQLTALIEDDTGFMVCASYGEYFSALPAAVTVADPVSDPVNDGADHYTSTLSQSKKPMSTNNLTVEEVAKAKHKKSSSFSNSEFPETQSNHKGHRKTKSFSKRARNKAISLSSGDVSSTKQTLLNQLHKNGSKMDKPFQVSKCVSVSGSIIQSKRKVLPSPGTIISLLVLFLLVLSGLSLTN